MAPWIKDARERRKKHNEHYNQLMAKEGVLDLPDTTRFHTVNGTLGHRCRERIVRAQQRRAMDQLKGTGKSGYLAKWRKNYSQSGWWCDLCDFFTYFPDAHCNECGSNRPTPDVLWKYAYRKEVREEAVANIERALESENIDKFAETNYMVGKGKFAQVEAPTYLDSRTEDDWVAQQRRQVYYTGRQDDLANESQKIAAYNMMVCMTESATGEKAGVRGIHLEADDDEDIGELVRREIEAEDAAKKGQEPPEEEYDAEQMFLDKLTSVPLLDRNNQFVSFEEKLEIYKQMFAQYADLQDELKQLSSDSESDEEASKSKKLQEAQRKRREDDFKSHLAFLHHEDFLNQLGQEAIPQIEVKTEIPEDQIPYRNRFADEFDATVPEAIVDLRSSEESSDSDDIDDDFYDRKKERDPRGRYTIPHRRGPSGSPLRDMVKQTEVELNAAKRKKHEKPPEGISQKQWKGKSDLQKLREQYRGEVDEPDEDEEGFIGSRRKSSRDDDSNDSGLERIKVDSFTQGKMSQREILRMNDKLFNVEALKEGGNRKERRWREEGLYFDALGRRKYRDDRRDDRRDRDRDRRDDRRSSSRDSRRDDRDRRDRRRRSRSPDPRGPRWGPEHPDFKHGIDKLPLWYVDKYGLHDIDKDRRTWAHSSQNDKDDLMPIKSWGYDKSRLRKDIDDSREGKRREHMWGSRGADYERRRQRRRERSKSPDRNETEHEKRKRLEDEYKRGYERARREIARRSVSVMRELGPSKPVSTEYFRDDSQRRKHRDEAKKLSKRDDKELDERDEDMVDDIVDILYSRKYGTEIKSFEKSSRRRNDSDEERRYERRKRREAKKAKKEKKKSKKAEKKKKMEELESRMKSDIRKKLKEKSLPKDVQTVERSIRREKEPSQDRILRVHSSESSPDSDSSSLPTDEDNFFDIPSPAEDGEVMDEKQELNPASFDKINREFTMKERIRQRLIERESFLPFGSVRFDTKARVKTVSPDSFFLNISSKFISRRREPRRFYSHFLQKNTSKIRKKIDPFT